MQRYDANFVAFLCGNTHDFVNGEPNIINTVIQYRRPTSLLQIGIQFNRAVGLQCI